MHFQGWFSCCFFFFVFFLDFTNAFISFDTSHRFSQEDFDDMPYAEVKQLI